MQVYSELTGPTAVTHSLTISLTSATANNLVVAKGNLLQIFETRTISAELDQKDNVPNSGKADGAFDHRANDDDGLESSFLGGDAMLIRADRSNNTKLVLVAEIPVSGTVIGLARLALTTTSSGGEALLLAFKAAKLSLTEWDASRNTLEAISIHYYEKDDVSAAPWEVSTGDYVSYLVADPGSRCAAFKFGYRNLAILPFRQSEEDLEMDDWDEDLDGPRPPKKETEAATNGHTIESAYTPSFVLRLPLLDPSLLHPVHFAFLHEYREPTFGILSSSLPPSTSLGLKDHLTYKVFTLDLQQRASTTILSVTDLPRDLFKVLALPAPIGGALLIGENELIHVDQSGKPNGVSVNPMTKQITSFNMADQSDLNLRLEGCTVEFLAAELGELLLILSDGRIGIISFKIDGRTVSGISIKIVSKTCGGHLIKSAASCISRLGKQAVFVGSETGDSVVLGWSRRQSQEKRRKSRAIDTDLDIDVDDLDLDDEEDDDLYGTSETLSKPSQAASGVTKSGELSFRIHDSLLSIAPINDLTCGKPSFLPNDEEEALHKGVTADLQLALAVGTGKAGSLAIINRDIQPKVIGRFEFPEARGFWAMCVKKPVPKALAQHAPSSADTYDVSAQYDKYMIVAKIDIDGYETSDVYALTGAGFESIKDTEFEPAAGFTVEAGTMGKQMRIIQVLKSEVRCYDGDLGLAQILPMLDEETGAEPRVLSASIADPYLMLIRDDSSVFVSQMDSSNELEEIEKTTGPITLTKWVSGSLYVDSKGIFQESRDDKSAVMMFLLSSNGSLHIYAIPDLSTPIFVAEGLSQVPPYLSSEYAVRKGTPRETLSEILVADLGDVISQTPYLILRNSTDDITLYEPIRHQPKGLSSDSDSSSLSKTLSFRKVSNTTTARPPIEQQVQDDDEVPPRYVSLRPCTNIGGYTTVFLPGPSPAFILKSSKSIPRIVGLQGLGVRAFSSFYTEGCDRGFIYADSQGIARVTQLPATTDFTTLNACVRKVPLDVEIAQIAYHQPTETYIAGCHVYEPFELPKDDDYHKEWAREVAPFPPNMPRGVLKLINPITWTSINDFNLEPCESIESMKTLNLEVSEETKERRMLVTIGSAISKGEDLPTRGRVQVLDIITVIPEPGHPETNRRLKPMAKEDIPRGAVTALSEIGTQGLLLIAQGQKCMVRGLKEDGSMLPVAFLDMNCHVASARSLPRSGLCLVSDAFKGVWFAGYTEEPYTFKVLGKSGSKVPILVADFLPDGEDCGIVVIDTEGEMHILEFNPEHPKSLQGNLLLHRTTFTLTPNIPSQTLLLPTTTSSQSHTLLLASPSGHIAALTPIPDSLHRRLHSLQTQLQPLLVPNAGLNPRAHRITSGTNTGTTAGRNIGVDTAAGRSAAVVDGDVVSRWRELSCVKRGELAGKGGYESVFDMRSELGGVLGWSGLGYF